MSVGERVGVGIGWGVNVAGGAIGGAVTGGVTGNTAHANDKTTKRKYKPERFMRKSVMN